MLAWINWRLVFRSVLPAVYIPIAALIAFAIVVAMTGIGSYEYITEIGVLVAGSSFVLVFARLAARDPAGAIGNVAALAMVCWLFVSVVGAFNGGWRHAGYWVGLVLVAGVFAIAALVGLRWARRWARWRTVSESRSPVAAADNHWRP
jgi:hypothetical protein